MKAGLKSILGIVCLSMLFGPVFAQAKCKCGKPKESQNEKLYVEPVDTTLTK